MRCPSCGNENREEARFCDSCGATLGDAQAEAPQQQALPASEGAAPLPPGSPSEVAGRYTAKGFLGQGGRKRVYLADDAESGREVALAMFDTEGAAAAVGVRARREAQAMGKLAGHPHIVDVYDTGEQDGNPYIVSEYVPGGDVEGLLDGAEARRLEVARAVSIATDVCRALEHAHGRGIVHRDIKPANVWLSSDGAAQLGDFGLATTEGRSRVSETGTLVGTVAYLPPEQALGQRSGPRSDLYSLGALLYEMLTGQPPFSGDDAVAIITQHINSDPVPLSRQNPEVSRPLEELVAELLAKRPEERPPGAAEVRERLAAAAEAPPVGDEGESANGANPLDALAGGVFVGRESEIGDLRGELGEALAGRGRVVLLVGEPGIGKTRTTEELATYAQVRGARVLWGRCREDEGAPAYWPWVQAIRSYVRDADPIALGWQLGAGAADVAQLVPEAAEKIGRQASTEGQLEGEEARFQLFDSVTTFLTAAARDRPMVIVLDDLHWADEPSLRLLQFASRELSGTGLLIVGTYRDVELGRHHPLAGVLNELTTAEGTRRITLRGLDTDAVGRYVKMATGVDPPDGLAEAVHAQTEGNPFFLGEVVRLLASEGRLTDSGTASTSWRLEIPQGVREVVGRRLDRLSSEANAALTVAAAIGREFDGELVARVADLSDQDLRAAADEAMAARLVRPVAGVPGRFTFDHALVQETLLEELSQVKSAQLHARIAKVLEELSGGDPARIGDLAEHYLEAGSAGDPERAIDYANLAAGRAMEQLAYEEAAEFYERALEVAGPGGESDRRRRLQLLLALGEAQTASGQFPRARETFEQAADAARELDERDSLARAALGVARLTEVGDADETIIALVEESLGLIGEGDSALRSQLLRALSAEMLWVDAEGRARPLAQESLEMARRVGDPETLAAALHARVITSMLSETSEERMGWLDEMQEAAEAMGDREFILRAHAFRLREYLELGEIDAADRELETYAAVAEKLRMPSHLWHVPMFRAMRALIDGDLDAAERLAEEARAGGERAGEPLANQFFGIQMAQIRRFQGRGSELLPLVREMAERYPKIRAWRTALASGYVDQGQIEEATVEFERLAAHEFDDIPRDAQWLASLELLAEVCSAIGDEKRAERLYEWMLPHKDQILVAGRAAVTHGPASRHLGMLASCLGRTDEAIAHFERSLELSTRMGDRPLTALSRINHAELLLRRDRRGDKERALDLLGEAIETARMIGAGGIVERGLGLRLEAQGLAGVDITTSIDEVISAVESERPDLRAHAAPDGTVTILFSDIEDSTILTERLGDQRWLEVLREHNAIFREQIERHDGYEVKNQGDGFMLAFPDPREALECAIEVQRAFSARAAGGAEDAMRIRMGLHSGEVIAEEGDFFGKNVILAARIAAKATGGEILVSEFLKEKASEANEMNEVAASRSSLEVSFSQARELELKGLAGTHLVHKAEWEPETAAA